MKRKTLIYCFTLWAVFLAWGLSPAMAQENRKFKVLAVFSYEETHQNTIHCKKGIEAVLGGLCEIRYFYMNTKMNFSSGPVKAKEAFALYQEFRPDGVIATEDDAQSMFVLPYLKDRVKTPVTFCAVNAEPEKYGYPASHISGILERLHIRETLSFVQQLLPSVKTVGFMMKESPVATLISSQISKESDSYSVVSVGVRYPKTLKEALAAADELKSSCDVLYITALPGLIGEDGRPMEEKEMYKKVINAFGKPVIGDTEYHVRLGALCAVVQRMYEQGETAAQMLLKVMQGTPVSEIPLTRNQEGRRVLNTDVLKKLGIRPRAEVLVKTEFVRSEE